MAEINSKKEESKEELKETPGGPEFDDD